MCVRSCTLIVSWLSPQARAVEVRHEHLGAVHVEGVGASNILDQILVLGTHQGCSGIGSIDVQPGIVFLADRCDLCYIVNCTGAGGADGGTYKQRNQPVSNIGLLSVTVLTWIWFSRAALCIA
jgi:hypothetical protein